MSFRCQKCGEGQKPGTKPIRVVVAEKEVEYLNHVMGELGREVRVVSHGREIGMELSLCPGCAGVEVKIPAPVSAYAVKGFSVIKGAKDEKDHRKSCKRDLGECHVCARFAEQAAGLPLHFLGLALENPNAPKIRVSLGAVAFSVMQDKTTFNTRRAAEDVKATYGVMAPYANRGGRI